MPLEIGVTPSMPVVVMAAEQLAPYLGNYGVTFAGPNGGRSPEMKLAIVNARGSLHGILDQPNGEPEEMEYLPTETPDRFMPALLRDGRIYDVEVTPVDFDVVNGRATGFTAKFEGKLWMQGKRKN